MLICMFQLNVKLAIVVDAFSDAEMQFQTSTPL
jgi:hypothetical protein